MLGELAIAGIELGLIAIGLADRSAQVLCGAVCYVERLLNFLAAARLSPQRASPDST
jgi:hypothetical protein